jgi:hypothetical protein
MIGRRRSMRDDQQLHRQNFVAYRISYTQVGLMSYQVTAIDGASGLESAYLAERQRARDLKKAAQLAKGIEEHPRKRRRTATTSTPTPRPAKGKLSGDSDPQEEPLGEHDDFDGGSEASSEADDPLAIQAACDQEAYDVFFGADVAEDEPEPDPLPVLEVHGNQWLKSNDNAHTKQLQKSIPFWLDVARNTS